MKRITILVPCYNEGASLPLLYEELKKLIDGENGYEWEVLFVNDGSKDNTLQIIKELHAEDHRIAYVNLSRNFGKENAMLAGFDYATGDCMVIMDADLQHPPHVIPKMIRKWEEGFEDVYGKRLSRGKESWLRKRLSLMFYSVLKHSVRYDILPNVGDFRLLDRKCIDILKQMRESERYTKGMYAFIGLKKTFVEFETQERVAGKTSWNFMGLMKLAVEGVTSFTTAPLRFSTLLGAIVSLAAFIYMMFVIAKTVIWGEVVQGYPTLVILILFLGGVQLLSLGVIGEYIARIFNESKHRPVYIVEEYEGDKKESV